MFSLVKFDNDKLSIVNSKKVDKIIKGTCVVKYNGGKYSALLVAQNDEKSYLLDLKIKKESISKPILQSKIKHEGVQPSHNISTSSNLNSSPSPKNTSPKNDNLKCKVNDKLTLVLEHNKNMYPSETLNIVTEACRDKKSLDEFNAIQTPQKENFTPPVYISPKNSNLKLCKNNNKLVLLFDRNENFFKSDSLNIDENQNSSETFNAKNELSSKKASVTLNIVMSPTKSKNLNQTNGPKSPEKYKLVLDKNEVSISSDNDQNISGKTKSPTETPHKLTSNESLIMPFSTVNKYNSTSLSDITLKSESSGSNSIFNKEICTTSDHDLNNSTDRFKANTNSSTEFSTHKVTPEESFVMSLDSTAHSLSDITLKPECSSYSSSICNKETCTISDHDPNTSETSHKETYEDSFIINLDKTTNKHNSTSLSDIPLKLKCSYSSSILNKEICNTSDHDFNVTANTKSSTETSHEKSLLTPNESFLMPVDPIVNKHNSTSLSDTTSKPESSAYSSSIYIEESSFSEYLPETSTDVSKEPLKKCKNISENNTSVDVIDMPINVEKVEVPHSTNRSKKHFCIFCKTLQSKISRHIFLRHKDEKEVKKASILPKKSMERLKIINELRKKGDFLHNTSSNFNSGILIVSRQQQRNIKNKADDYVCCTNCKAYFSKRTLRIHTKKCLPNKNKRTNFIESRRSTQYMHSVANKVLKSKIFPVLRDDIISRSVRYDELILKFGNKLTEKYSSEHQHDMIRANLRLLGRFKIELKQLDPDINELKDIFKPHLFDKCVKALRTVAQWDEDLMWFKTPAVAQNLTSLIKKCGKKQRAEFIKEEREDLKIDLENFLLLWEEEIPTLINKKAVEDQNNKRRDKKVVLPSREDIKKLHTYLKEHIMNAMETLMNGFRMSSWMQLVQTTLIFIQIFNRRRAGEIERLTIDNFGNKEKITDNIDKDSLKNLSQDSIKFAKQFVRITLRGKLGRTVSVLLCPMCVKAIELIINFRGEAGIADGNKYIFCKPSSSTLSKQYHRACPLLKKFSEECGAKIPESLRGTTLRKHIATYTSLLNVEEASVDRLANFMGHHKDIHKTIYRMSVPVAEITCVSKLLMAAVGDEDEMEDEYGDDENVDEEEEEEGEVVVNDSIDKDNSEISLENSHTSKSSSSRKRRSTSPFGKTKRTRWNSEEKDAIYSIFGDLKDLERLPNLKECLKAIQTSSALKNRTPQQIKTWIDNQRRYKMD